MSVVEKDVTMGWHTTVAHDLLWVFDIWGWIGNLEAQTDQSSSFPSMDGLVTSETARSPTIQFC